MKQSLILLMVLAACGSGAPQSERAGETPAGLETMLVAGGCFWCVEADLEKVDGVNEVVSGYAGGTNANPTYDDYARNGHREVAQVRYDPEETSFEELAEIFIRTIDVTDDGGQFCDRGDEYSTAVYYGTEGEKAILEEVIAEGEKELGRGIVTPIEPEPTFYPAEDYHQDYYMKNQRRYGAYRWACGRDRTVRNVWGQDAGDLIAGK